MQIDATLAIVVGDFSREATFRFCNRLIALERDLIKSRLPRGASFYDEYRLLALEVFCDLPFLKAPHLTCGPQGLLDDRVLVGFPRGIRARAVLPRLAVVVFQALSGAYQRGLREARVLFPCNTMAPMCWELADIFGSAESLLAVLAEAGFEPWSERVGMVNAIVDTMQVSFPTPPEAVIAYAIQRRLKTILPLGTLGIADVYAQALARTQQHLDLVYLDEDQQAVVLQAIKSGIAAEVRQAAPLAQRLEALITQIQIAHRYDVAVVLACTDLTYDFGIDSTRTYAEAVIDDVYRHRGCLPTLREGSK